MMDGEFCGKVVEVSRYIGRICEGIEGQRRGGRRCSLRTRWWRIITFRCGTRKGMSGDIVGTKQFCIVGPIKNVVTKS